jgi:hypothetical protein
MLVEKRWSNTSGRSYESFANGFGVYVDAMDTSYEISTVTFQKDCILRPKDIFIQGR